MKSTSAEHVRIHAASAPTGTLASCPTTSFAACAFCASPAVRPHLLSFGALAPPALRAGARAIAHGVLPALALPAALPGAGAHALALLPMCARAVAIIVATEEAARVDGGGYEDDGEDG